MCPRRKTPVNLVRARVRRAIEETLDAGLPRAFTPDICRRKVSAVLNHVFESFQGPGERVCTRVARTVDQAEYRRAASDTMRASSLSVAGRFVGRRISLLH